MATPFFISSSKARREQHVFRFRFNLGCLCVSLFLFVVGVACAEQTSLIQINTYIEKLKDKDNTVRREAADVLVKLGAAAVPPLGAALGGKDDDLASATAVLLGEIGKPSIPVLANVLKDKRFYDNPRRILDVVNALACLGPDAVTVMVEASSDKEDIHEHYFLIARALHDIGTPAIPNLIKSINGAPPLRRFIVAMILTDINDAATIPVFIGLLNDEYSKVRAKAANSLQRFGPKAKAAVPALIRVAKDVKHSSVKKAKSLQWVSMNVRVEAIAALGKIAPEADIVFATLINALQDEDSEVRSAAASSLGTLGKKAAPAVPYLLKALKDVVGGVRKEAVAALGKIMPKVENVLPAIVELLNDRDPKVRGEVATAFGQMRAEAKTVVPILIRLLGDSNRSVRSTAAAALGQIGREAKAAVPSLSLALKDGDERVRRNAAKALANMGPGAEEAVTALMEYFKKEEGDGQKEAANTLQQIGPTAISILISALKEQNPMIRQYVALALGQIQPKTEEAVPALVWALKDNNSVVRKEVANALGNIGPKAKTSVSALCEALHDEDSSVRVQAVRALGSIGPEAKAAVTALIESLRSNDLELRRAAASALGGIGPEAKAAVQALSEALKSEDIGLRSAAASALGGIGPKGPDAVPALINALKDDNSGVRSAVASSLGKIGPAARTAIPALIEALNDDSDIRGIAADVLVDIATGLQDVSASDSIKDLNRVYDALAVRSELATEKHAKGDHAKSVKRTINHLELIWWHQATNMIASWSSEHPWLIVTIIIYLFLLAACILALYIWPSGLLRANLILAPYEVKIPPYFSSIKFFSIKLPLRKFLLVGFFNYHTRVLDAWIKAHIGPVRRRFSEKETVNYRKVHIAMPVTIDGSIITELTGKHLKPTFEKRIGCLLIWGEGGSGKTSLACQVAKWAMAEEQGLRISKHYMLPVLIEEELDSNVPDVTGSLTDAIRRQLQILCDESVPISEELLDHLLRQQRLLVIIDHFSEMSTATQAKVQPGATHFSSNALIVTSRLNEDLKGVTKTVIKPLRIVGNHLSDFMGNYLTRCKKRELFTDAQFFKDCGKLSEMVGDREVTVLLAKLYAEQMILVREGKSGELPNTIPDLMIHYLNEINRGVSEGKLEDSIVHRDATIIAWECLRENYRPTPARITDISAALGGNDTTSRLKYLEDRLRLIQTIQPVKDRIRFLLDPLSEYLAGLHLIETYANNEEKWREFLDRGTKVPGAPESIKGFLLAVRDCCIARQADTEIPGFVVDELNVQVSSGSEQAA